MARLPGTRQETLLPCWELECPNMREGEECKVCAGHCADRLILLLAGRRTGTGEGGDVLR